MATITICDICRAPVPSGRPRVWSRTYPGARQQADTYETCDGCDGAISALVKARRVAAPPPPPREGECKL